VQQLLLSSLLIPPATVSDISVLNHYLVRASPTSLLDGDTGSFLADSIDDNPVRTSPRGAIHSLRSMPRSSSSDSVVQLCEATATGDLAQVEALLASGMCYADEHEPSVRDTALHVLCRSSNSAAVSVPMLESLLHHKADPMARNHLGSVPLHNVHPTADATLVFSLAPLMRLSVRDNGGWTPLHRAAASGHLAVVRALIECDAEIDALGGNGLTPLHVAICNARTEVVELLLSVHADANRITASNALTSVHLAAVAAQDSGSVSMLCVLAKAHVDFAAIDSLGETALHVLARTPSPVLPAALLPYLLRNKCPAFAQDHTRLSALELAVRHNNVAFTEQLQIATVIEVAATGLGLENPHLQRQLGLFFLRAPGCAQTDESAVVTSLEARSSATDVADASTSSSSLQARTLVTPVPSFPSTVTTTST